VVLLFMAVRVIITLVFGGTCVVAVDGVGVVDVVNVATGAVVFVFTSVLLLLILCLLCCCWCCCCCWWLR